jgi:hypothetical protein
VAPSFLQNGLPLFHCLGRDPLATPQHIVDKSVIHTEDDKYMIYEVEELSQEDHKVGRLAVIYSAMIYT